MAGSDPGEPDVAPPHARALTSRRSASWSRDHLPTFESLDWPTPPTPARRCFGHSLTAHAACRFLLVPGLAAWTDTGARLRQGGGMHDRSLLRADPGATRRFARRTWVRSFPTRSPADPRPPG